MNEFTIEDFFAHDCSRNIMYRNGNRTENLIPLYHGSPNKVCTPQYGFGEDKHDYGRGFYTTLDYELACEWAVCTSAGKNGYVHKYSLDTVGLTILNFNAKYDVLGWLATLAKHRSPSTSKKYKENEKKLIKKYYDPEIEKYDIIVGYRADDSFFSFAKQAIRGEVDISLLKDIMTQGKLGYQVFLQSEKAFQHIQEVDKCKEGYYREVDYNKFSQAYNSRDKKARDYVANLIDSDENTLEDTIEKYIYIDSEE